MITPYRSTRTGMAVNNSTDVVVSVRGGGSNRLSLLAMMVPLLLLVGMGTVGMLRHWMNRPPFPDTLNKLQVESLALDVTEQIATGSKPEILASSLQVGYSVHNQTPLPEWSVISRAGKDHYLLRVNGRLGKVFAINRMDDISGQVPNLRDTGSPVEAGITPPLPPQVAENFPAEPGSDGKQAAESAARRYLPVLGLLLRDVRQYPSYAEPSFKPMDESSTVWTFTYYLKSAGDPPKNAIKVSVDSNTGRLESFWNPVYSK